MHIQLSCLGGQGSESYAIVLGRICRCWRISRRIPQARNHFRPLAHAPTLVPCCTIHLNVGTCCQVVILRGLKLRYGKFPLNCEGSIEFLWKFLDISSLHLKVVTFSLHLLPFPQILTLALQVMRLLRSPKATIEVRVANAGCQAFSCNSTS